MHISLRICLKTKAVTASDFGVSTAPAPHSSPSSELCLLLTNKHTFPSKIFHLGTYPCREHIEV